MTHSVLLLSAYDAVSHRLWRERLCASFPQWQWTQLTLPPRHFAWRIRSNGLQWAYQEPQVLQQSHDLVIATSMVDLATLRGLCPPIAHIPTVVYFHENQFAYPLGRQRRDNLEPLLVPLYSALCADQIVFNTKYNRDTFLSGVKQLFQDLPDALPVKAIEQLESAMVIPVALPGKTRSSASTKSSNSLTVVWNHRWEYDKGPDLLLAIVRACSQKNLKMRLHIVGQQFRDQPTQFAEIDHLLQQQAQCNGPVSRGEFGYLQEPQYRALLSECDVVLSTALHDFQGLAVQEAVQSGCFALTPNDLAYPEYLPAECLYTRHQDDAITAADVVDKLAALLAQKQQQGSLTQVDLTAFGEAVVRDQYAVLFKQLGLL